MKIKASEVHELFTAKDNADTDWKHGLQIRALSSWPGSPETPVLQNKAQARDWAVKFIDRHGDIELKYKDDKLHPLCEKYLKAEKINSDRMTSDPMFQDSIRFD